MPPKSPPRDALPVKRDGKSTSASTSSQVDPRASRAESVTADRLRLASTEKCSASAGERPAPTSIPTLVTPLPRPQAAFPVGTVRVTAAASSGPQAVPSSLEAAAVRGKSPKPEVVCAPTVLRTSVGAAPSVSQRRARYSTTPPSALREELSVRCTVPALAVAAHV